MLNEFYPDDSDLLRRRVPKPVTPKDLARGPSPDLIALIQQLLTRVERLEEDMQNVKKKLKLPSK